MQNEVSLTPQEAACLELLRAGVRQNVEIASQASLNFRQAIRSLRALESKGLASSNRTRLWDPTPRGQVATVSVVHTPPGRGRPVTTPGTPGQGALRLLAVLDRPRHGTTLPALLGVTKQRVHQLIVALVIRGLVRCGDPDHPTFVVARPDETSILLSQDQERMLSVFPEHEATTLGKIARVMPRPAVKVAMIAESLQAAGLIERAGNPAGAQMVRLTQAGAEHWQRARTARHAEPPPLPFRSERVIAVLSHLANQGPTRTRDIGLALKISQTSINALMQYLKRRTMVRTQSELRFAPYELTADGRAMLAALTARAAEPVELAA